MIEECQEPCFYSFSVERYFGCVFGLCYRLCEEFQRFDSYRVRVATIVLSSSKDWEGARERVGRRRIKTMEM